MLSFLVYLHLIILSHGIKLEGSHAIVGASNITIGITLEIDTQSDQVDITLSGPSDRWFGLGFGNTLMDQTYAIIGDEDQYQDIVTERKLGDHNTGAGWSTIPNQPILNIINDATTDNLRLITMQRNRNGYYTFPDIPTDIDIIWAFSFHGSKTFAKHEGALGQTYGSSIITLIQTGTSHPTTQPTIEPTTQSPTAPTMNPSTSQPTQAPTHEYNICYDTSCPYVRGMVFTFLYAYDDDDLDWNDLESFINSIMKEMLLVWIPNILNIDTSVGLTFSTNPQMVIETTVGIESDEVYVALEHAFSYGLISDNIESLLPPSINDEYKEYGFSVAGDIESEWIFINGTYTTTTTKGPKTTAKNAELYHFITFDFAHYTLYDYVVFIGGIVSIVLLCVCCGWCYRRMRKEEVPESVMRAKTGVNRDVIYRREPQPLEKPQIQLFSYSGPLESNPSQDNKEDAPVESELPYKPGYQASPMEKEFNKALGALDAPGIELENRAMGKSFGGMSTVSFGRASPAVLDVPKPHGKREEKEAPGSYDYEQDYYGYGQHHDVEQRGFMGQYPQGQYGRPQYGRPQYGQGQHGRAQYGQGPPMVSGSMVDRMNSGHHLNPQNAPPPMVTGSMVDRMNRGNALY